MYLENGAVTKGNTCDTSFPDIVIGRNICECACKGGIKSSSMTSRYYGKCNQSQPLKKKHLPQVAAMMPLRLFWEDMKV
jgi:hypothetical protein